VSHTVIPTIRLLNSATLVGFSGGLRLYLAFLLAGIAPDLFLVFAASLIIYATYTLDRSLENKEDSVNHPEFVGAHKKTGLLASGACAVFGTGIFFASSLISPPIFPFIVGILYSKGIPLGNRIIKLKGSCGIKNLVIGITWGGTIGLIIAGTGQYGAAIVIGLYFGMKLFINSTIFDLKDVEGDLAAGIRTLPVVFGEQRLRYVLMTVCLVQHALLFAAMAGGLLIPWFVFLAYSFSASILVIFWYSPAFEGASSWIARKFRILAINYEPMVLVVLSRILPY
jgi:4-hydroxybenzoate polyprenyltransferase